MSKQPSAPPPGDKPAPSAPPPPPAWRHWLWPIALGIALVLWIVLPTVHSNSVGLTYSQFISDVQAHKIKTVTLDSGGGATGTLSNGSTYSTVIPTQAGSELLDKLQSSDVAITAETARPSFGSEVLSWLLI